MKWIAWTAQAADDKRSRCKVCGQFADEDGYCTTIDCVRCGKTRGLCAGRLGEVCEHPREAMGFPPHNAVYRWCESTGGDIVYSVKLDRLVHGIAGRGQSGQRGQNPGIDVVRRSRLSSRQPNGGSAEGVSNAQGTVQSHHPT